MECVVQMIVVDWRNKVVGDISWTHFHLDWPELSSASLYRLINGRCACRVTAAWDLLNLTLNNQAGLISQHGRQIIA